MPKKMVEAKLFLQLEPEWSSYRESDGTYAVRGVRVTKMFQRRPKKIIGVAVELTVRLPAAAFKPLSPTVVIEVPEGALEFEPMVTVEMPGQDEENR